eukprot:Amastigsp_a680355_8.p3 type:complete len:112 gc:universal Amastigsp_a680355_8:159-494(+)
MLQITRAAKASRSSMSQSRERNTCSASVSNTVTGSPCARRLRSSRISSTSATTNPIATTTSNAIVVNTMPTTNASCGAGFTFGFAASSAYSTMPQMSSTESSVVSAKSRRS